MAHPYGSIYADPDEAIALQLRMIGAVPKPAPPQQAEEVAAPAPPEQPAEAAPALPEEKHAHPQSSLGEKVPEGQPVPAQEMHHATMKGLGDMAHAHRMAAAANADALANLDVSDPDYTQKLTKLNFQHSALTKSHGEMQQAMAEERQANPWGTMGNHPGIGGKIGHAFGVIGNVAGNATLGEENMAAIPGSEANIAKQAAGGEHEVAEAGKEGLQAAQTEEQFAQAKKAREAEPKPGTPEEQAFASLEGQTNPDTNKPYTHLEAYQKVKQTAQDVKPTPPAETPLGIQVGPINQALTRRWQVLNPGQPLPPEYTLQANATKSDFDRVDKLLAQNEGAVGTQAQRDLANEARKQTQELARQRFEETKEQKGLKWVTYTDANGRTLAGPLSQAKAAGAKDMAELPAMEVRDVQNARHVIRILTKTGDSNKPETNGVLQLIDSLDKDGKLGVLASRYNRFLTSGVGSSPGDDPRIITLIDKNMLADTGTMLAHFGASGGRSPQMLQHFLDLANSGKMDGVTLRAGIKAIADYMQDRAMLPAGGTATSGAAAPGGKTISAAAIQKAAKDHNVSLDEAKKQAQAAGYTVQ